MKRMYYITLIGFLWSALLQGGCKKDVAVNRPNVANNSQGTSPLESLWKQPLAPDTTNGKSTMPPLIIGNKVIFSCRYYGNSSEFIRAYDNVTGQILWEWSAYTHPTPSFSDIKVIGDKIIVCAWAEVYVIDSNTGQTAWVNSVPHGLPRIAVIGNYIYHTFGTVNIADSVCYLVRSPVDHPKWDTVYVARIQNGFSPSIESTVLWINSQGDSILIFQNRQTNFTSRINQIDLVGYNLVKKKNEFFFPDIDKDHGSSTAPITVYHNKIYFLGLSSIYCIDPSMGTIIWTKIFNGFGENFAGDDIHVIGNTLIVKPWGQTIYSLDPLTGSQIWKTDNVSSGQASLFVYSGTIYFMSGNLNAVDFSSGKLLWIKKSPNENTNNRYFGTFDVRDGIALDPSGKSFYTGDDRWAMRVKLPN
jgi:outer membrane protein assembly factor BamB